MRPIVKSKKSDSKGNSIEYKPWGKSKIDLIKEIGSFCSFCEKKVNRSSLHIEHLYGRNVKDSDGNLIYAHLKYQWDNFLLACCNCNSVKGNKDISISNPFLPHLNNLVHFIEIGSGGIMKIKNAVAGEKLKRTLSFIELVGLDREPSHPRFSSGDDRWESRLEAWDLAERQFIKYIANPKQTDLEIIITLAREKGFFSVWYYKFFDQKEVIDALINGVVVDRIRVIPFEGTDVNSFHGLGFSTEERP